MRKAPVFEQSVLQSGGPQAVESEAELVAELIETGFLGQHFAAPDPATPLQAQHRYLHFQHQRSWPLPKTFFAALIKAGLDFDFGMPALV